MVSRAGKEKEDDQFSEGLKQSFTEHSPGASNRSMARVIWHTAYVLRNAVRTTPSRHVPGGMHEKGKAWCVSVVHTQRRSIMSSDYKTCL
jgi:hypothetical protein